MSNNQFPFPLHITQINEFFNQPDIGEMTLDAIFEQCLALPSVIEHIKLRTDYYDTEEDRGYRLHFVRSFICDKIKMWVLHSKDEQSSPNTLKESIMVTHNVELQFIDRKMVYAIVRKVNGRLYYFRYAYATEDHAQDVCKTLNNATISADIERDLKANYLPVASREHILGESNIAKGAYIFAHWTAL